MPIFGLARSNEELIKGLKDRGELTKPLEKAMQAIPRDRFVPKRCTTQAWVDAPLPIGYGQTISQPTVVARMTRWLDVQPQQTILELGAGSGWQAGLLGWLVGKEGKVVTIDRIPELVQFARKNLKKAGIKNVEVVEKDGTLGYNAEAPYDRIMITAAAPDIPPPLKKQLKEGGKIEAPIGQFDQSMFIFVKKEGKLEQIKSQPGYRFVPLLGKYGFK